MGSQIDIKNLTVGYHNQAALLINQNLRLKQGEFVALVGKNGSGKSSLLRTLANFQPSKNGDIFINGINQQTINAADFAKLVSVVLTDKMSLGYNTVFDVVAAGRFPYLGMYGKLKEADIDVINKSLTLVGMSSFAKTLFDKLSDGQQQKVILAKALAQETPYIFLDEPMAFLDLPSKMELSHILHDLAKREKKGILISTHDLDLAIHTCHSMWLLNNQKITVGMPEDLALNGWLGEVFNTGSVRFNNAIGHFEFESNRDKKVTVLCESSKELFWLTKALHRNNYLIVEKADITISKAINRWEVIFPDKALEVNTLEELIKVLP